MNRRRAAVGPRVVCRVFPHPYQTSSFFAAMLATPLMLLVCRLTVYWIIKNSLNENLITFQMNFNAFQSEIFKHVLSLLFLCLSIHTRIHVHEFVTCVPHARIN